MARVWPPSDQPQTLPVSGKKEPPGLPQWAAACCLMLGGRNQKKMEAGRERGWLRREKRAEKGNVLKQLAQNATFAFILRKQIVM